MKPNRLVIAALRERSGLSQTEAAEKTGGLVSRSLWANIEAGRRDGSPKTLRAIATVLRVPLDAIIASYSVSEDAA